jgi:hypothetical protein
MKAPLVLWLSLAANLALGAAWYWRTPPAPVVPATARPASPAPTAPTALPAPGSETWTQLQPGNDAAYIAQLRAEGFPTSMVYAVTNARVRARHAAALKKFRPPADFAYWREEPGINDPPIGERPARRTLERQIAADLKDLLGRDSDRSTIYQRANRDRLYGPISEEKADQLSALNKDYGEISALVRDRAEGFLLQADRDQLAVLEKEKRADLARILTPQELLEYDLRASPSANSTRGKLQYFDATEEEFRALATLQLAFDATYGAGTNLSGEQQERRAVATLELAAQTKVLLTPERYAEYEIKTDMYYFSVVRLIGQNHSDADPAAVVGAQRELAGRLSEVRQNRNLTPAARNAQLDALAAETNTRMSAALGPTAFEIYKRTPGPLTTLLTRPAPKP